MSLHPLERTPQHAWKGIVAIVAIVVVVVLGSIELGLRHLGFEPSVTDTAALFGLELEDVDHPDAIALVGTSRFQVALDPEQIEAAFPGKRVHNLSLVGQSALPVLEFLAEETEFRGVAAFEFMPLRVYTEDSADVAESRAFLERVRNLAAYSPWETRMRVFLQSRFALFNPEVRLEGFLRAFLGGEAPRPHQVYRPSRFAPRDYGGKDMSAASDRRLKLWKERFDEALQGEELEERLADLHRWTKRIQERGGTVLFFRINSSGSTLDLETARFPRAEYWDRFAAATPGVALHFGETSSAAVVLPEGSHADRRDAAKVTEGLIEGLRRLESRRKPPPVAP